MPKGFAAAQKAGSRQGGAGFHSRPKGINFFKLPNSGDSATVRFLQNHEDIEWVRQWKTAPSSNFPYGEKLNAIDQFEDGTPDPGYAAGLKSTFTAFPVLIWRQAPVYAKDAEGKLLKDGNGNKQLVNYADQVAVWECSYTVYETLRTLDQEAGNLMSCDFKVVRQGTRTDTKYIFFPSAATPITPQDSQLAATQRIDVAPFVKIPTYDELYAYLNGGVTPEQPQPFPQQVTTNASAGDGPNPFM